MVYSFPVVQLFDYHRKKQNEKKKINRFIDRGSAFRLFKHACRYNQYLYLTLTTAHWFSYVYICVTHLLFLVKQFDIAG